ncbi:MAG: peptidyl-tRNA hydrolase Pth2 [Thermoplasmata archaeon]|nr:peptidyl-tRNA hydrolase Pth2 [Thermoplasmata archaeon]
MEYKLMIAVRDDLKMSGGKLAVQVAHAAVACALSAKANRSEWFSKWYGEGQRKVVVRARDIGHLRELEMEATRLRVPKAMISDAGLTELAPGTTTCIGIGPAPASVIDQITGSLPLA